jgi:hypothetical protein
VAGVLRRAVEWNPGPGSGPPRQHGRWSTCWCSVVSCPPAQVELAVRGASAAAAIDGRAVQVLARRAERAQSEPLTGLDDRGRRLSGPSRTSATTTSCSGREAGR